MSKCVDEKIKSINVTEDKKEELRMAMNNLADESRKADIDRVQQETNSVFGSMDMDQSIMDKINDGTYKLHTDKSAILSIINNTFNNQMLADMVNAYKTNGNEFTQSYSTHIQNFVKSVKESLQKSTAEDIVHKFIVVDTDNEYTTAFWASDNKAMNDSNIIDNDSIVVLNGKDAGRKISNNGELLLHEFTHSVTESALRGDGVLLAKISAVQKQVMKQLTYSDLLAHIEDPTLSEISRAKEILRYMNGSPSEFLAYYISNPNVYNALEAMHITIPTLDTDNDINVYTTTTNKFKGIINKLISVTTNGPTAHIILQKTLQDVIEKNMQIKSKVYTGKTFDDYASKVTNGKFKVVDDYIKEKSSRIEDRIKTTTTLNPMTKKHISDFINKVTDVRILRDIRDSGVIQSIMHTAFKQTTDKDVAAIYQLIRKVKSENDKEQNSLKESNARVVNKWFKDVSLEKRSAMTSLLSADTHVLGIDIDSIADLLDDPKKLNELIRTTSDEVGENEYLHQARDLGYFLQHNEAKNSNMETNAYRIYYRMYNGSKQAPLNSKKEELTQEMHDAKIASIDKLATLYALKYMDVKYQKDIVELIRDKAAVTNSSDITDENKYHVVDAALHFMQKSVENEQENFSSFKNLIDKGYIRKATTRPTKSKIVSEDMLKLMSKQGYGDRTKTDYDAEYLDAVTKMKNDGKRYFLIAGPDYSASRTQGAIHDIGFFDQVQQMKDTYDGTQNAYEENRYLVEQKRIENENDNTFKKKFKELTLEEMDAIKNNLVRVIKVDGTIADYSMPISNKFHENKMNGDRDVASVLAATVTHRSAKNKAIRNNIGVINYLIDNEQSHINDPDYVVLRAATKEEKMSGGYKYSEQWNMIPEYTRAYISNLKHSMDVPGNQNSILIHKDMVDDFIGYKDASLANLKIGEKGRYFDLQNYPIAQLKIQQLEYFWKKMIARYKTVLVILSPHTIIGNAWSNMNIAYIHGIDPKSYYNAFVEHWKQLDEYNAVSNELMVLEAEKDSGMTGLENRINGFKQRLEANSMHELIQDGQFSMIIEDIDLHNNKEDHVEYHKRRLMEKVLGKTGHEKAKLLAENIAVTKSSASFKLVEKLTNYNDIINRKIIQEKMLFDLENDIKDGLTKEEERSVKNQEILNYLDQLFVNYSYLDSKYIKYINDVGLFMFTKYFFRALKTAKQVYDKHPLSLMMFLGADISHIIPKDMLGLPLDENPYKGYADPLASATHRLGPAATFGFGDLAQKVLMPGVFDFL